MVEHSKWLVPERVTFKETVLEIISLRNYNISPRKKVICFVKLEVRFTQLTNTEMRERRALTWYVKNQNGMHWPRNDISFLSAVGHPPEKNAQTQL